MNCTLHVCVQMNIQYKVEDGYHVLLVCLHYSGLRVKFLEGRFNLKISKNSTHKKKRYIHVYTEEKTTTCDMPFTNSLSLIIYIK